MKRRWQHERTPQNFAVHFHALWGCFNSIRGCGVIKKRNKKYNPNKPALNPVRKFQLIGEAIEENRILDLWQLTNGKSEDQSPELAHLLTLTKGTLVIAMRKDLIDKEQSFHIACEIHAKHSDGTAIKLDYEIAVPERMTYSQFLGGADIENGEDPIYVRDKGIKTRWEGANKLMDAYFHETAGPGFKIVKQPYIVTCFSAFKNMACQREFKAVQISLTGNGLGVAA